MSYTRTLFSLLVAGILLSSCTEVLEEKQSNTRHPISTKVVNVSTNANHNVLLVKLKKSTSNVDFAKQNLASVDGVTRVESLFTSTPGMEEIEAKHALNRWFTVHIDENQKVAIDNIASIIAESPLVECVEFNTKFKRASDGKVVPLKSPNYLLPRTRAGENKGLPFNDPYLNLQWHYINTGDKAVSSEAVAGADVNVKDAWTLTTGDPRIIVAVIDEGVKYNHPDLAQNMWVNEAELNGADGHDDDGNGFADDIYGYNFASNCPIKYYTGAHGTHVAGTIAAVNNNGVGVSGVAGGDGSKETGVRIMSCQIFDDADPLNADAFATSKAFKYAADNGASIAQCSWGVPADKAPFNGDDDYFFHNRAEKDAINYFMDKNKSRQGNPLNGGGIVIFAAGNEITPQAGYPGAYNEVIAVSSFNPALKPAWYTNYNRGVNIAAPGGEVIGNHEKSAIYSTVPTDSDVYDENGDYDGKLGVEYGYMQGTSMACPHVSGVAALGLSYALKLGKQYTVEEFNSLILTSVGEINSYISGNNSTGKDLAPYKNNMGTGAIDAWKLLMNIEGVPCLQATINKSNNLHLNPYFGDEAKTLTYLSVEISNKGMESLGLKEKPSIKFGKLRIKPTKLGSAKIKITAIAGGTVLGSGKVTGGKKISREVSVISRSTNQKVPGWL